MFDKIIDFYDDLNTKLRYNLPAIMVVIGILIGVIISVVLIVKYVKYQKSLYKPPPPPTTTPPQTTQPLTFIKQLETNTRLQYIVIGSVIAVFVLIAVIAYFATAGRREGKHRIRRPEYARRSYSDYK